MKSVGIDLAGKSKNPTGFAILEESRIISNILHTDEEIIDSCIGEGSEVIAIDSPLSFSSDGGFRKADLDLLKRGYRLFPPDFGGMRTLTKRGINISKYLGRQGFEVIEVHPLTSGKIIFDSKDRKHWITRLSESGFAMTSNLNEHEIDSIIAAITGNLYLKGKTEKVGKRVDEIVIPKVQLEDF